MAEVGLSATFTQPGDFVGVNIYLQDGEVMRPDLVQAGLARLMTPNGETIQQADFDAAYGNEKGFFRVIFMHPLRVDGLSVVVDMTLLPNGATVQSNVAVQRDPLVDDDFDVLAEQQVPYDAPDIYPHEPGAN